MRVYTTGLADFFPRDAIGGPRRKNGNGHRFELILDGLNWTVVTDIGSDPKTGKRLKCIAVVLENPRVTGKLHSRR